MPKVLSAGLTGLAVAALCAMGMPSAQADEVLANITGYTYSLAPDTSYKDTNPTSKLTDGNHTWSYTKSVGWTCSPTDTTREVTITFKLKSYIDLRCFRAWFIRWDIGKAIVPQTIAAATSMDGNNWTPLGNMTAEVSTDMTAVSLALATATPQQAHYVRMSVPLTGNGAVYMVEASAEQGAPRDNVLVGSQYIIAAGTPNGQYTDDAKGRKLTDGILRPEQACTIQWNFATLPTNTNPALVFSFERPTTLHTATTYWLKDTANGIVPPEVINIYGKPSNSSSYRILGSLRDTTMADETLCKYEWSGEETEPLDEIQFIFNRAKTNTGVCAIAEAEVYGQGHPMPYDDGTRLAFVTTITALPDVYFRPLGVSGSRAASAITPDQYPALVKALHDNYFANTIYVEWNGEVDRATALAYFKIWADACAKYSVEFVPCFGLVQWDYLRNVNPAAEYGNLFYAPAPMLDCRNTDARNYFAQFIKDLTTTIPNIKRVGTLDLNQYYISLSRDYEPTLYDYAAFGNALLAQTSAVTPVAIFQQPYSYSCAHAISGISSRVLDTYCFLLDETYSQLQSYATAEMTCATDVEADLVIVTDPGERFEPAVEVLASQAIRKSGAGLSLDLIITSAVAHDYVGENFYADLVHDGFYQGYYSLPFEAVRRHFKMLHTPDQPPAAVDDWSLQ